MFWVQAKLIAFAPCHSTRIQSRLLIRVCLQRNVAHFKISSRHIDRAADGHSWGCSFTVIDKKWQVEATAAKTQTKALPPLTY